MVMLTRRQTTGLVLATAAAFLPTASRADDYPSRPVRIIAPFGAGGPTDVFSRAIALELDKALHQNFFIENRPGAGTTLGTELVAKATPDGYTLLMASSTQTVNETLYQNKAYALMRDLVPVAPMEDNDLVLVVSPGVPAHNVAELVALAKAKPGTLNFGSSGPGSNYHMAAELLKNLTGIDIVHVPYKGSTGMRIDILSGQIQILFDSVPTMAPYIKAGKVRALGTSGAKRSPILPDVPTIAEDRPRLRIQPVGRLHGAEGNAGADRRQAARHHHCRLEPAGHQEILGGPGRRAHGNDAAAIRRLHAGAGRQMG